MTEKLNTDDSVTDETTTKPEGATPVTTSQEEKKFSQKELDTLIQNRLKREKDNFTATSKTWEDERKNLTETTEKYEKLLGELLSNQMEGLSEGEKKLLAKLPILDQVEYLKDVAADSKKENAKIPLTPKPNGKNEINAKKISRLI